MIDRAPILKEGTTCNALELERIGPFVRTFLIDVVRVNKIIAMMIRPTYGCVYIEPKRGVAPNGRKNYMIIFHHFLVLGNMDYLARNIISGLQNLEWSRDTQTWNWDDSVAVHMDKHNIIEGLTVHGFTGIDSRSKVSYLYNGIKSSALAPMQAMILMSGELHHHFT